MKSEQSEKPAQPKPTPVRLPDDLRIWLKHECVDNERSLNSEIIYRLEQSRNLQLQSAQQ